jgi:amino acid transporter
VSAGSGLSRRLGLVGLAATGICSMLGAGIYVVPFMIQRNVPGIGPHVLPAFMLAAVPALLAAAAYAILASAMPRAGGSYVYASRALNPYLGFVASFSQWFGLSIAIGVISYVIVPFFRDVAAAIGSHSVATALDSGPVRVTIALALLWLFVGVNLRGLALYERTLIPLMILMFALGAVVIVAGFSHDHADFAAVAGAAAAATPDTEAPLTLPTLLAAAAVLFSSFIGFDSIAQAGGEAKNPGRTLPLAIGICVLTVGTFYVLFTGAVYHAVPWSHVAAEAALRDVTAPGLLGGLLDPGWTVVIITGAAIALLNDLPAMLLSVSRLMFAWAADGIFPAAVARVHRRWHTPHIALLASGAMATLSILGSHLAGDFFLGVDLLVTSMLVNFFVMCVGVLALPHNNPALAAEVKVFPRRGVQVALASAGAVLLAGLLVVQVWKDLSAPAAAWYFRSTPVWLCVLVAASLVYRREMGVLRRSGVDVAERFRLLPPE